MNSNPSCCRCVGAKDLNLERENRSYVKLMDFKARVKWLSNFSDGGNRL